MEKYIAYGNYIRCEKCGHCNKKHYVELYGTCLCGNVLDKKAKFNYEMNHKLRLWRKKNRREPNYERMIKGCVTK